MSTKSTCSVTTRGADVEDRKDVEGRPTDIRICARLFLSRGGGNAALSRGVEGWKGTTPTNCRAKRPGPQAPEPLRVLVAHALRNGARSALERGHDESSIPWLWTGEESLFCY